MKMKVSEISSRKRSIQARNRSTYDVSIGTSVKSVESTLSHQKATSVPRAKFTRFLVKHGLFQ